MADAPLEENLPPPGFFRAHKTNTCYYGCLLHGLRAAGFDHRDFPYPSTCRHGSLCGPTSRGEVIPPEEVRLENLALLGALDKMNISDRSTVILEAGHIFIVPH